MFVSRFRPPGTEVRERKDREREGVGEKRNDGEVVEEGKRECWALGTVCRRRSPCVTWTLTTSARRQGSQDTPFFSPSTLTTRLSRWTQWSVGDASLL